jgi:phosphinothricin acetyltransferase
MKNEFQIRKMQKEDCEGVMNIFNYYIENSFAAYTEKPMPYGFFDMLIGSFLLNTASVILDNKEVIGFCGLRAFNPFPVFNHTAEVSYFIHPKYTGKGLGKKLLSYLEDKAREAGIKILIASISSRNENSLKFHKNNGFTISSKLENVGFKNGMLFDVVYMQKEL